MAELICLGAYEFDHSFFGDPCGRLLHDDAHPQRRAGGGVHGPAHSERRRRYEVRKLADDVFAVSYTHLDETDTFAFPAYKNFGLSLGTMDSYLNDPPSTEPPTKRNSFQFTMGLTYAFKSKY